MDKDFYKKYVKDFVEPDISKHSPPVGCIWLHDYVPVSVQHGYISTFILKRCTRCNDFHTNIVKGHWTIDQVKGGDFSNKD